MLKLIFHISQLTAHMCCPAPFSWPSCSLCVSDFARMPCVYMYQHAYVLKHDSSKCLCIYVCKYVCLRTIKDLTQIIALWNSLCAAASYRRCVNHENQLTKHDANTCEIVSNGSAPHVRCERMRDSFFCFFFPRKRF